MMRRASQYRSGFTIVELLIVIVVIAILAAITIVAYNGIQDRAKNAAAQSAASQAAKKLMAYAALNSDQYPATLADADIQNADNSLQYTGGGTTFCITATTQNVSYFQRNTTQSAKGACEGHGKDGVAAIANLSLNPSLEANTNNWSVRWYGTGGSGTTQRVADAAYCGSTGYRKTWTVSGSSQDLGYGFNTTGVTAGQTYTFSVFTRSSLATGHKAWVSWADASGTGLSSTLGTAQEVAIPANTWRRLSSTQTAPAGAVAANFFFGPYPAGGSPNYTAGATLDADCGMVTQGSAVYTYADGETNGWAWSGTRHNSTSSGIPQ